MDRFAQFLAENEEAGFVAAIAANPKDQTDRLVYADWLDDHNYNLEATFYRMSVLAPFEVDLGEKTWEFHARTDQYSSIIVMREEESVGKMVEYFLSEERRQLHWSRSVIDQGIYRDYSEISRDEVPAEIRTKFSPIARRVYDHQAAGLKTQPALKNFRGRPEKYEYMGAAEFRGKMYRAYLPTDRMYRQRVYRLEPVDGKKVVFTDGNDPTFRMIDPIENKINLFRPPQTR